MTLSIKPLGGVGQIGSNSTLITYKETNIIIDCGILFPAEQLFDINYLIPDLSQVDEQIDAIIITHGHEDHIGAVAHYVEAFPQAQIYAPLFARELILEKLSHTRFHHNVELLLPELIIDEIKIESFHVNHSIPDTKGLMISTHELSLLFISDFKIDFENPYERPFDFSVINEHAKSDRMRISLLDSTNIMSKNYETPSERIVAKDIETIINNTKGNCYITTFSSNIHRIQTIIDICHANNTALIPYGRSMKKYIEIAQRCALLDTRGVVFEAENQHIKRKKVILCTGSQAEMRGASSRIASGTDKFFKLKKGDSFIFSSKAIPGNEKTLSMLYNKITEQECDIFLDPFYKVHVSGHPGKSDLKKIYEAFNPHHAIPIHGESLFLKEHSKFIDDNKLAIQSHIIKNFDQIDIKNEKLEIMASQEVLPILIHGDMLVIDRNKISERRKLASLGCVFLSVSLSRTIVINVSFMGLPDFVDDTKDQLYDHIAEKVRKSKKLDNDEMTEKLRVFLRQFYQQKLGYRPLAIVHIN